MAYYHSNHGWIDDSETENNYVSYPILVEDLPTVPESSSWSDVLARGNHTGEEPLLMINSETIVVEGDTTYSTPSVENNPYPSILLITCMLGSNRNSGVIMYTWNKLTSGISDIEFDLNLGGIPANYEPMVILHHNSVNNPLYHADQVGYSYDNGKIHISINNFNNWSEGQSGQLSYIIRYKKIRYTDAPDSMVCTLSNGFVGTYTRTKSRLSVAANGNIQANALCLVYQLSDPIYTRFLIYHSTLGWTFYTFRTHGIYQHISPGVDIETHSTDTFYTNSSETDFRDISTNGAFAADSINGISYI